jgi:predicted esterase
MMMPAVLLRLLAALVLIASPALAAARSNDDRPLSRHEAEAAIVRIAAERRHENEAAWRALLAAKAVTRGDKTMRFETRTYGEAPPHGHSLWISLHGGGNAPTEVNDQQWRNQINLYQPAEGIYLAPRAPTDTWNLWHEGHIDPMLQQLIDAEVAINGVDPDRIYLMGYSAGGDGVWRLAPRLADRFAAAAMMAGHPGDVSLLPLRNLPFALFVGGADSAYDRNTLAVAKTRELERLHAADPNGYVFLSRIYPGLPHWMNRRDAEAVPWMARFTRNPWPRRIVWVQNGMMVRDDPVHERFYWLHLPGRNPGSVGGAITADVEGQEIRLDGNVPAGLELRLSDRLINLDRPVTIRVNGYQAFHGRLHRTLAAIRASFAERFDPASAATALWVVPERGSHPNAE